MLLDEISKENKIFKLVIDFVILIFGTYIISFGIKWVTKKEQSKIEKILIDEEDKRVKKIILDELKKQPGSHALDDKLIELYRMDAEKNTRKAIDDEVARRVRGLKK